MTPQDLAVAQGEHSVQRHGRLSVMQGGSLAVVSSVGVAIALWVRLLGEAPAWRDEVATLLFAGLPPDRLWDATAQTDRSMIVYYLLVSPLTKLADPLLAIRWLSFLGFVITVGAVAALCVRLGGVFAGLVGGIFVATHVSTAALGVEARSYPLFLASFTVATLILVVQGQADGGGRARLWVVYSGLVTIAVAMNVLAASAFVAHFLFLLVLAASSPLLWRGLASMFPGALVGVVLVLASRGQTVQLSWLPEPSALFVKEVMVDVLLGQGWAKYFAFGLWVLASVTILAVVLKRRVHGFGRGALLGALVSLTSLSLLTVISLTILPVLISRYALSGTVGAAIWISVGVAAAVSSRLKGARWLQVAATGMLLALIAVASLAGDIQHRDGSTEAAKIIRSQALPGEYVISIQPAEATGTTGALALALRDEGMWEEASAELFDGPAGTVAARVKSTAPWSSKAVSEFPRSGRAFLVTIGEPPQDLFPACALQWSKDASDLTVTLIVCP